MILWKGVVHIVSSPVFLMTPNLYSLHIFYYYLFVRMGKVHVVESLKTLTFVSVFHCLFVCVLAVESVHLHCMVQP